MAANSKISWTDHTFNPWIGCMKVSPACDHCYAEALNSRYKWATWGAGGNRHRTSANTWKLPRRWNRDSKRAVEEGGRRLRVFCASLSDWLDNEVPAEWRADLVALIESTPGIDWLLLTKRIGNLRRLVPDWYANGAPENVWLGITCADQAEYDRDWPKLQRVAAPVRFISHEPALGGIYDLGGPPWPDWMIDGGESGPQARPYSVDDSLVLEGRCKARDVAFFRKQLGARPFAGTSGMDLTNVWAPGADPSSWPAGLWRQDFPTPRPEYGNR